MSFAAAPEYQVFPSGPEPLDFYEAVVHATLDTRPLVRDLRPQVAVSDILTLAPALAAELEGVPLRHAHPPRSPAHGGATFRSTRSARACRAAHSAAHFGDARSAPSMPACSSGARSSTTRASASGLRRWPTCTAASAASSRSSLRFPQLEYPRPWPDGVHVVGPLMWEPPTADVELPPGDAPLVLVAPSTAQDTEHRLLSSALRGLADAPVRVLATWNRRLPPRPLPVPANTAWSSGSPTRAPCPTAMSSSATPATARSRARSQRAAPSSPARPSAT